jgi:NH3-dependent NAD+ synthetase
MDLRKFISFAKVAYDLPVLQEFLDATPSAELLPIENGSVQTDTEEMGFQYEELSVLGRLRKVSLLQGCMRMTDSSSLGDTKHSLKRIVAC